MTPVATANGYRTTSASANLKNRPENFRIWTEAMVKRVIFDGLRATGVELVDGRKGRLSKF
jgi:choline dehydrogenase-like flavoprotein